MQIGAWKLTGMVREMTKRLKYLDLSKGKQSNNGSNTRSSPTVRELACLRSVSEGLTASEIGDSLKISSRTVDHHVASVMRKLSAPTRAAAVTRAIANGLIKPDEY